MARPALSAAVCVKTQPSLALPVSGAAFSLLLGRRHAGSVHLDVENRHGRGANLGQVQLLGRSELLPLDGFDAGADRLALALHGLGGDLQSGRQLQLLAALLEAGLGRRTDRRSSPARARPAPGP